MAEEAPRRTWRTHPLIKRLALIAIVAVGLWLWKATDLPERQIILQLTGDGWSSARALDLQVLDDEEHILKREELFFANGPPPEVTFKMRLPEGTFRALLFVKVEGREPRVRVEERLTVGEGEAIVRQPRLPAASR
ncbi:hypothetical protein [Corallococcus aberystwythensis]|uniref:Uncharacterized protein n=1 Tax=Corallococcus aberystwythensis TaxID=2316722 RepID=A0A3A8PED9_9BACT|nr:hypothetical protein [Corallococcus aberystwythensis]RKH54713.1 hypothetical protein D7W81_37815 [Corallococcus aberystwythensis]